MDKSGINMETKLNLEKLDNEDSDGEEPMPAQMPGSPPPIPKRLVKTALHQAVLDGRLHQVRLLVSKHGANVDCKDINGRTPLMLTSMIDQETGHRIARILISAGAAMNIKDNMGRTALSYACLNGMEMNVNEILRGDILNINDPDNDGNTALHHAASSGNPEIVKLLTGFFVKFGLDIDTRNKMGYTALLLACKNGHFVSAHVLLKGSASPTLRDGETYLNATEWANKSRPNNYLPIRRLVAPPSAPLFSRESTMYGRMLTPVCKHTKSSGTLTPWTNPEQLMLTRSETFIGGKDARQVVLDEIYTYESQNRSTKSATKRVSPPTAKLMALTRRSRSVAPPSMISIFKIYSDQYQPDWRRERTSLGLSRQRKMPSISQTATIDVNKPSIEVTS